MKKLLSLLLLGFAFCILHTTYCTTVRAQESAPGSSGVSLPDEKMIVRPPVPGGSTSPFLGQSHYYSYVFRGNGEAVVTVKVVLANTSESEVLKEAVLRFPAIDPKDITVYQIIGSGQCIRYDNPDYDQLNGMYRPPTCLEYGDPDYYEYYGTAKYQKADFDYKGDTLTIKLPKVIYPQKSGSYFVYFRAFGIAHKQAFGSYRYSIETLKVDDPINQLTVGIDTDSDLFLKGVKGEVNYRFAESDVAALKAAPMGGEAAGSPAIDRFIGNIGYGTITNNASNLAPLESYKVEGMYAKSRFSLYAKETSVTLGIFFAVVIVSILIIRKVVRSINLKDKTGCFLTSLGLSFVASVMMALYTVAIIFTGNYLNNFNYQYQPFIALFLVLISFCIYSFLLFAPGMFVGYKKGIGCGIGLVIMTIMWIFIFFVIALAVLFFLGNSGNGISPIPLMKEF